MFLHENEKCPVCDKLFTPEDDIVICHKCGTPHHRECYNRLGHCANADKHGEDFSYKAPNKTETTESSSSAFNPNNEYYQPNEGCADSTKTVCKRCGREIEKNTPFCCYCGEKQMTDSQGSQPADSPSVPYNDFEGNNEKIDGKSVKDVADTVKSNSTRFIKKFRKNRKVSWNWGGFFFNAYYLFFRKMYKEGIIALAVNLIATLVVNGVYVEQISAYSTAMNDLYNYLSTVDSSVLSESAVAYMQELQPVIDSVMPAFMILFAVRLVISVVIALFADRMYKFKVMSIIDKVDKNLEQGAQFGSIGNLDGSMNISQQQMKTLYLGKSGGISLFSPVIAYCVLDIITSLITNL